MAKAPDAALRMLAALVPTADVDGEFTVDRKALAERFGVKPSAISATLQRLINAGCVMRTVKRARYLLTGSPYAMSTGCFVAKRIGRPSQPAAEPPHETPCTYRTARECGIEPTTYMTPNRGAVCSSSATHHVAITLARVPSLERALA